MALKAIDCHVHPWDQTSLGFMGGGRLEAMSRYFGRDIRPVPFEELADSYRAKNMMAVLLATDDSTTSGLPPVPNDHVARAVRDFPDVFLAFGGVDPWKGQLAIDEAKRCKEELGLHGLKFEDDERQALATHDYVKLFELGAHPFLTLTLFIALFERDYPEPLGFQLEYASKLRHWLNRPYPDVAT